MPLIREYDTESGNAKCCAQGDESNGPCEGRVVQGGNKNTMCEEEPVNGLQCQTCGKRYEPTPDGGAHICGGFCRWPERWFLGRAAHLRARERALYRDVPIASAACKPGLEAFGTGSARGTSTTLYGGAPCTRRA